MDLEYDRKFEEMKKYIPFLENMIKRLETSNHPSNPRQAQLNKIKSLRDLLIDRKKRMKMENLLKCEQVLINLYAKVEQRDLPDVKNNTPETKKPETDLNLARKKLKSAVSKLQTNDGTLPEIARANVTEEICVPGSKEPALFQRRPNMPALSTLNNFPVHKDTDTSQVSKKNYTRVLLSPEGSPKHWSIEDKSHTNKLASSKRSPKKSPSRQSPVVHKKERRKSKYHSKDLKTDALNITLNVPKESLNSLNTKDIFSRIINCSNDDVDIDTLRELRTQILGELKETGAKDDISDIILKSYKKKNRKPKTEEVEEGELSDSESETIESIYGSLVIMDKEKLSTKSTIKPNNSDQAHKIQICLVINSDKNKGANEQDNTDLPDKNDSIISKKISDSAVVSTYFLPKETGTCFDINIGKPVNTTNSGLENVENIVKKIENIEKKVEKDSTSNAIEKPDLKEKVQPIVKPNFYKSINDQEISSKNICKDNSDANVDVVSNEGNEAKKVQTVANICETSIASPKKNINVSNIIPQSSVKTEIPLLDATKNVSEIDILQALKKEILSETKNVLAAEPTTPLLHIPKVTKVVNALEIGPKKRISIENYKAKVIAPTTFKSSAVNKEDGTKKQSLKLTEKECERFNFLTKIKLDTTSDDEDKSDFSLDDMYGNMAPKSPDHDDFADTGIKPPVIIPSDPIETVISNSEADIDMRKLVPALNTNKPLKTSTSSQKKNISKSLPASKDKIENVLIDPRVNRDSNPNQYLTTSDKLQTGNSFANSSLNSNFFHNINSNSSVGSNSKVNSTGAIISPNILPSVTCTSNVTGLAADMAPIRTSGASPNVTPNAQTFESDNFSLVKKIYTPLLQTPESCDNPENQNRHWETPENGPAFWNIGLRDRRNNFNQRDNSHLLDPYQMQSRDDRFMFDNRDMVNLPDCLPNPAYSRMDCPSTPNPSFGRMECPPTPNPSFGRMDCPPTPNSSFGRMECPPNSSFGWMECPSTPNTSFGRMDSSMSPLFSRSEGPLLHNTKFGRIEQFNRNDFSSTYENSQDLRFNRHSDYDSFNTCEDSRERGFYQERNFNNLYKSDRNYRSNPDNFRNSAYKKTGRNYRESVPEASAVCSYSRDYDSDRSNSRNRSGSGRIYENRNQREPKKYDDMERRSHQREKSVGRTGEGREQYLNKTNRNTSLNRSKDKNNEVQQRDHIFSIDGTFQTNKNESDSSFNARRLRASSVGRALIGDSFTSMENVEKNTYNRRNEDKKCRYKRASSVGREVKDNQLNFKDIKDDLKSFKCKGHYTKTSNFDKHNRKQAQDCYNKSTFGNIKSSHKSYSRDPRIRRENSYEKDKDSSDSYDKKQDGIVYSHDNISKGNFLGTGYGVKNYKIPKIKRQQEEVDNKKTENKLNDTGCGSQKALNQTMPEKAININNKSKQIDKIEVIKHNTDSENNKSVPKLNEKIIFDEKNKRAENKPKNVQRSKTEDVEAEETNLKDTFDHVEKRITRSVAKNISEKQETSPIKKIKKKTKLVIYDSDSDDEEMNKKNLKSTTGVVADLQNVAFKRIEASEKIVSHSDESISSPATQYEIHIDNVCTETPIGYPIIVDSSFGVDDLELFSDNIVQEPVIDNINDLIADLDSDLDSAKIVHTKKNLTIDLDQTMLMNIASLDKATDKEQPNSKEQYCNFEVDNKSDSGSKIEDEPERRELNNVKKTQKPKDDSTIAKNQKDTFEVTKNMACDDDDANSDDTNIFRSENCSIEQLNKSSYTVAKEDKQSNEALVTTSVGKNKVEYESLVNTNAFDRNDSSESIPDSTISSNEMNISQVTKSFPDSTNESKCEMSSDITSTHNNNEMLNTTNSMESSQKPTAQMEAIGQFLTMLQDKTKIKELLGLLSSQCNENDKIKKKLEKLSEIVSDDEESNIEKNTQNTLDNSSDSHITLSKDETKENNSNNDCDLNIGMNDATGAIGDCSIIDTVKNNNEVSLFNSPVSEVELLKEKLHSITENSSAESTLDDNRDNSGAEERFDNLKSNKKNIRISHGKKGKNVKGKNANKASTSKRQTRSDVANLNIERPKKMSRELQKLQDDLKEMFIRDDVLGATGIRMCRLAKLTDESKNQRDEQPSTSIDSHSNRSSTQVVLKKINDAGTTDDLESIDTSTKKRVAKSKKLTTDVNEIVSMDIKSRKKTDVLKVGSKSKPKLRLSSEEHNDPYIFETDPTFDTQNVKSTNSDDNIFQYESDSQSSSKSFDSTGLHTENKKKVKRKRSKGWKAGIIKIKKKKTERKQFTTLENDSSVENYNSEVLASTIFTDKMYCFRKNQSNYCCRLCSYSGNEIVQHYKKHHPHSEIPLSRMSPAIAKEAVKESLKAKFQIISKISSKKYVCRFCFEEYGGKKLALEGFFWHIVSMHTGEYKQLCSECLNVRHCPFKLDIPPPPKDVKGQLIGYLCEKCNYTQISLENLKTHVITRHNDEQTAVYTINFASMSKVIADSLLDNFTPQDEDINNAEIGTQRVLRSTRSNQSNADSSDIRSDITDESSKIKNICNDMEINDQPTKLQSKIAFENDNGEVFSNFNNNGICEIKKEPLSDNTYNNSQSNDVQINVNRHTGIDESQEKITIDIVDYPHFKVKYSETGSKEYICCINRNAYHYKTTLLISLKKHVQIKHTEIWDGYCYLCKVIVTPQGIYHFKDCLQHMLDKHNNFPNIDEELSEQLSSVYGPSCTDTLNSEKTTVTSYINVRPMSDLITNPVSQDFSSVTEDTHALPVIEKVVSLGTENNSDSNAEPNNSVKHSIEIEKKYDYEEAVSEIMSNKYCVVLQAMMTQTKMAQIFKCAGRYCSFTTDSAEDALLHASTHMQVGGETSLKCTYCDFDSSDNAIDLITHVFKHHGRSQYACNICFYRAASSQSVDSHINRVHSTSAHKSIIYTSIQAGPEDSDDGRLLRDIVVEPYVCLGDNNSCNFKTFITNTFEMHLHKKHSTDNEFLCWKCPTVCSSESDLMTHTQVHSLNLYQCVWCLFGTDSETGLFNHSSLNHPNKPPKAYLRIVTHKEKNILKILPLAQLSKSDMPTITVTPNEVKEDPIREAERSIELESFIGKFTPQKSSSMEPTANTSQDDQTEQRFERDAEETNQDCENLLQDKNSDILQVCKIQPQIDESILKSSLTPDIKKETESSQKTVQNCSEVVCLDSDEEDMSQSVVDLSENQSLSANTSLEEIIKQKILPPSLLFECSKCKTILKYCSGFKKHILKYCFINVPDPIPCAHCNLKFPKMDLANHYTKVHSQKVVKKFECSQCSCWFTTLANIREHERTKHSKNLEILNVEGVKKTIGAKRQKRSLSSKEKTAEPPEKIKRFGPHDVHLLPINPILDDFVLCSICEFSTKVRHNMVRHLQLHAEQQPVPQVAPVNPVPHLESNEKHFDKMVNLASSSITNRIEKNKSDSNIAPSVIPPETAGRYPKYVPEKHRLTCGAQGCSYISVDESMLQCHWETLHSDSSSFHCIHCPPYQQLDTSTPLTAGRVITHLKMHGTNLYACSLCSYYHHRRQILESHLSDVHVRGSVLIVREAGTTIPASPTQPQNAPTMDLKPWQCGLCKFKTLLRLNVVDHCAKFHNSKMQYKCAYCGFRTSNSENIIKHENKSHEGRPEEIFYFYYQEGTVADDPDGTPRWQNQSERFGYTEPKIKCEVQSDLPSTAPPVIIPSLTMAIPEVDLNLVKKEIIETPEETLEDLCREFGQFCEPNGLKYKCCLCNVVIEDTVEAMQSHLYEELKYRKWGCSICSYKAFHKTGLREHMHTEHPKNRNREPVALEADSRIESWIAKLLEHQTNIIQQNLKNLARQKEEILRSSPGTVPKVATPLDASASTSDIKKMSITELEKIFGSIGSSVNLYFCCPKCNSQFKEEHVMRNHLESELNKIRWQCSFCSLNFQTYHSTQFHCSNACTQSSSRPIEVTRDASVRSSWVEEVIRLQKLTMSNVKLQNDETAETTENIENSLLVVRYEEKVPTPEEQMAKRVISNDDSDEERLVIDEAKKCKDKSKCPFCDYSASHQSVLKNHILRHYGLKPFNCGYCQKNSTKKTIDAHLKAEHANHPPLYKATEIPNISPVDYNLQENVRQVKLICFVCRESLTEAEVNTHKHEDEVPTFGIVTKCLMCQQIFKDCTGYIEHHKKEHPSEMYSSALTKLTVEECKDMFVCGDCDAVFPSVKDWKFHVKSYHNFNPTFANVSKVTIVEKDTGITANAKRKANYVLEQPSVKRVAKKSTTKLPFSKVCARKSTTKLPFNVSCESEHFSFYGTRPTTDGLENVTAMMPFCNTMVRFSLKKISEIININPVVLVRKL